MQSRRGREADGAKGLGSVPVGRGTWGQEPTGGWIFLGMALWVPGPQEGELSMVAATIPLPLRSWSFPPVAPGPRLTPELRHQ